MGLKKKILKDGLIWRVGKGDCIPVFDHVWTPDSFNCKIMIPIISDGLNVD